MDFSQKRWTFVTFRLYYPLCVSRRVDTWHIVYLSYKDPCPKISVHKSEIKVPFILKCHTGSMASDGNSQVSASKKFFGLAELPCNWLWIRASSIAVHAARVTLRYLNLTFMNWYFRTGVLGKLCAKYQLCAIRTADNTDGKSRKSIVSEKSPSFRPAPGSDVGRNLWICTIHGSACAIYGSIIIHSLRRYPWMFAQSMDFA